MQLYLGKGDKPTATDESDEAIIPGDTATKDNTNTDVPLSERPLDVEDYLLSSEESDGDSDGDSDDEEDEGTGFKVTVSTPEDGYDTLD